MLDRIRRRGARVDNLIDLGTGTGLLAFAGMHLWPRAYATATDIDPIAIDVTAENAETNGVPLGLGIGRLALTVADGTANALVLRRARYDLIVANILARSEEHTSELQSLMRISYAVFCLKKKKTRNSTQKETLKSH